MAKKSQPKTLKLKGVIKDRNVIVLMYSKNTHNYIYINFVKKLNHLVYPSKDLLLMIIDGQKVEGVGRCHRVSVQIQEMDLQTSFYALQLYGMDMVLGGKWLMQLENYNILEEQFVILISNKIINYTLLKVPLSRKINCN